MWRLGRTGVTYGHGERVKERGHGVLGEKHTNGEGLEPSFEGVSGRTTVTDPPSMRYSWLRLRTTLDLIRSNPTGRVALKTFVALAGTLVVAVGVVLIPLPGPGWLLVIAGLGIWAIEFHWARRLLNFTRRNVHAWTQWVKRQSWSLRIAIGTVGLCFVAVVVWLSLKYGLGIDVIADLLRYLATH